MKRLAFTTLVAAALALGAVPAAAQTAPAKKITLTGGSVGGAWSAIGNAIGETIRRESPGASFGYEPGREAANIQLVLDRQVELGIAHAQLIKRAQAGEDPFKAPITNLRAIALIDPQAAVQILVREESGIESFESILAAKKPVRIALNQRGTLMAVTGEEVFKAYGITAKDIEAWGGRIHHVDYNAALEMMKNGQIDIVINMLAFPSGPDQQRHARDEGADARHLARGHHQARRAARHGTDHRSRRDLSVPAAGDRDRHRQRRALRLRRDEERGRLADRRRDAEAFRLSQAGPCDAGAAGTGPI